MEQKIVRIDETDSTNRWMKHHAVDDADIVVWADYQTAGRGCGSNKWESQRGKNLLFSLLLHPADIPASRQFAVSQMVSVALCEVLEQHVGNVSIKWPNDIYVDNRKICGILIENSLKGSTIRNSIVGIGLNVNQTAFHSDAPNPVSLCQLVGREVDREELLHDFLRRLKNVSCRETLCADYENRLYRRRKLAEYADKTGLFRASLQRVLPDGRLALCDLQGRERLYAFKEVQFII